MEQEYSRIREMAYSHLLYFIFRRGFILKLKFESSDKIDFSDMKKDTILQSFIDNKRFCLCISDIHTDILDYVTVKLENVIAIIKDIDFDNMTIEIDDDVKLPEYKMILPRLITIESTDSEGNIVYKCKRIICFTIYN